MTLKIYYIIILFFATFSMAKAQIIKDPVHWKFTSKKISNKIYEVHLTATIDAPWHIYAHDNDKGLTLPTTINFNRSPLVQLTGMPKEKGKMVEEKVKGIDEIIRYYEGQVDFVQIVELKAKIKTNIIGTIEFMACIEGKCLPAKTVKFNVKLE